MTRWWQALLERRRAKHEPPFTAEEMAVFRCRVQRLIRAAKS
ncbi:hypothetical protein ACWKSP_26165 [Micromonosporaceae bacterium Da 78-11]